MNKTSIIIMIFCTAIIAAAVFFSLKEDKEAGIGDIYLVSCEDIEEGPIKDTGTSGFSSINSTIYAIIPVYGVSAGDRLSVAWISLEEDGNKIIQEDDAGITDEGGGIIAVYLLKIDSSYIPGEYKVRVDYNGIMEKEASFTITAN